MNKTDLLLKVALDLPCPFSQSHLIVAAWEAYKAAFGLNGFAEAYPCSNKVIACLCGQRGLVARGLFERLAEPGMLRLTAKGRACVVPVANRLANGETLRKPRQALPESLPITNGHVSSNGAATMKKYDIRPNQEESALWLEGRKTEAMLMVLRRCRKAAAEGLLTVPVDAGLAKKLLEEKGKNT